MIVNSNKQFVRIALVSNRAMVRTTYSNLVAGRNFGFENQELLRKFRTEAIEIVDGLQKFVADLKHHTGTKDFMIVNDNSAFDVAFVQFYLETYLQELFHLHYHPNIEQRYIPILDTDSLQVGFQGKKLTGELWGSNAKTFEMKGITPVHRHTHDPLDDAQCILEVLLAITKP